MRFTLKLPGLSPAVNQVILHFAAVFLFGFLSQLGAGVTGTVNVPTLLALLTSAAAAGVAAVIHVVLGLIPASDQSGLNTLGISLKVKSTGYQTLVSVVVMFLSILGASLVAGATHIGSLPDAVAVVSAGIGAGVTGVVQFLIGLVPTPKSLA